MIINASRHVFAFFFADAGDLTSHRVGTDIILSDKEIVRRLACVIRAQTGDSVVLFNKTHHVVLEVSRASKKELSCRVLATEKNKLLMPYINWYLPLLERDALEEALTALTVLGATSVQLVITDKVHRKDFTPHEHNRIQRSMIAAAEQSKQFVIPQVIAPVPFEACVKNFQESAANYTRLFFDHTGLSAFDMIEKLRSGLSQKPSNANNFDKIICMVGPEGDLTDREKEILRDCRFDFYKLTPTILRSKHAVALATGIIRSVT